MTFTNHMICDVTQFSQIHCNKTSWFKIFSFKVFQDAICELQIAFFEQNARLCVARVHVRLSLA